MAAKRSNIGDQMEFYASPIVPGVDVIHAEFMDRSRMQHLINKSGSKFAVMIEEHLSKHDLESTKQRIKEIKLEESENDKAIVRNTFRRNKG